MHDPSIKDWRAEKMLGDVYFAQASTEKALETYHGVYQRVPQTDADFIVMLARLIELSSTCQRFELLTEYTTAYLKRKPSEIDVAVQVSQVLVKQENGVDEALRFLDNIQQLVSSAVEHSEFVLMVGQLLQGSNDVANAIQWYLRAAELGENSSPFWLNLGRLLLQVDEFDAAQEAFERAKSNLSAED